MDKFDICVMVENELKSSENRVVIVSTPLFEEVARLLGSAYYVGVKDASVYVSLNKELLKKELA